MRAIVLGALCLSLGCTGKSEGASGDTDAESGIPTTAATMPTSTDPGSASEAPTESSPSTTDDPMTESSSPMTESSSSASESGNAETEDGPNVPDGPVYCGNHLYECGDAEDNDGDGFIDLFDPECTGPCDDDESSFQTGIPGDNVDCKQDCFFDGNSGQGDDGCIWNLRCDPENPGANIGCAYTGGQNCESSMPPHQDPECIEFCLQFVPPGCDCFGCCLVTTDEGQEVSIFLNSHPDCSLDNLDACEPCTQSEDCVNDCTPEECEVCFGETKPPEGCDEGSCDVGTPCQNNADCPTDYTCYLGCCYPPPPG